ncbi:glycerol-3-phosphate O-acyltransferase, partial [Aureobasidium melanogenum]
MAPSSRKSTSDFWANFVYDAWLWTFSVLVDLFFREVHPRSSWKVPRNGPVIIVAAPHANQFVDPLILMRVLRRDAFRRVCFLIAEKSMKRKFIGWGARMVGSVPVGRALDLKKPAKGKIYLPDPEGDPTLIKGVDTDFENKEVYMVGGVLALPSFKNKFANTEIKEILGPNEIRLKKPFSGNVALRQLTGQEIKDEKADAKLTEGFEGTNFEVAPHVDQGEVYSSVFQKLHDGGCIGIFPEGGSHDRTELLPLKAGVAIMALGALAEDPNCGVKIVPCGMNYFHAHKFRSRAVVEFGTPVEIPNELVEMYKNGQKREAVGQVLETVYQALVSVTVTSPDYDTLMLIQAVRRLYNPKGKKLPLPMVVELNRRLVKGYTTYKDDPRIVNLKKAILAYNKELMMLNIRDHQVSYAKFS